MERMQQEERNSTLRLPQVPGDLTFVMGGCNFKYNHPSTQQDYFTYELLND